MGKKTTCPITRKEFHEHKKPLIVKIGEETMSADPREFKTDSLGWYLSKKIEVEIDGKRVQVSVGLNMIIVGSKELPKDGAPPPPA